MEKAGTKTRDIQFYSGKNQSMVLVHTRWARDYAKLLEEQSWIAGYEAGVPLELGRFSHINPIDIRPDYFQTPWVSDFLLHYADGRKGVRELVLPDSLKKRAIVEKLELSRRYWAALDISDWKIVVMDGGG